MPFKWSSIQASAIRIQPGADLKSELNRIATENQLRAAAIVSAVGSLSTVSLRFANRPEATVWEGKHEIISLNGTLSTSGIHAHMSVANTEGQLVGGHVMEGSIIYTTLEIVIAELSALEFTRELCPDSGFKELVINPRNDSQ